MFLVNFFKDLFAPDKLSPDEVYHHPHALTKNNRVNLYFMVEFLVNCLRLSDTHEEYAYYDSAYHYVYDIAELIFPDYDPDNLIMLVKNGELKAIEVLCGILAEHWCRAPIFNQDNWYGIFKDPEGLIRKYNLSIEKQDEENDDQN